MTRASLRIGVVAGEASGDILGSRVLAALREHYPDLVVEGIGGPLMEEQGLRSLFPMDRLSVMGLVEPLRRLPGLLRIRGALFEHFRLHPPDLFLGIDAPDFNLYLERKLRAWGVPTAHLVSPSVWAWRQRRINKIGRSVDLMLCLFPFELPIYAAHGIPARFVGHPLADEIPLQPDQAPARAALGLAAQEQVLALLPGSRGGEVARLAPLFFAAAQILRERHPRLRLLLPAASTARAGQLDALLQAWPELPVTVTDGRSREVMLAADAVLMASGTATLEAMLLKRPMVVAYRMAALSWMLVSRMATTRFVALPNILAGDAVVPELLQDAAQPAAMAAALDALLSDGGAEQRGQFAEIHKSLRCDFAQRSADALQSLLAEHNIP
ncbi:lipid-A-disaccharide synthase [Halieaceae bacterium]|nr:lipid-A-disaccharide synthase [Halieaceae bacterium]